MPTSLRLRGKLTLIYLALSLFYSLGKGAFFVYLENVFVCDGRTDESRKKRANDFVLRRNKREWPREIKNNSCSFPQKLGRLACSLFVADSLKWNFRSTRVWNVANVPRNPTRALSHSCYFGKSHNVLLLILY